MRIRMRQNTSLYLTHTGSGSPQGLCPPLPSSDSKLPQNDAGEKKHIPL
jgi:hypothetical protein